MAAAAARVPAEPIPGYYHTAWTVDEGAPPDIWALAQTPDGFLWLGTGAGLYRFDGLRFEAVTPAVGKFPGHNITALCVEPDGSLWLGFLTGEVARFSRGRVTDYGNQGVSGFVHRIARAPDGTIWVARGRLARGGLAAFANGRWQVMGPKQGVGAGVVNGVFAARDGAIWAGGTDGVFVRRPGTTRFVATGLPGGIVRFAEDAIGRVWAGAPRGAQPFTTGKIAPHPIPLPAGSDKAITDTAVFDADGRLWETLAAGGVMRIDGLLPGQGPIAMHRFAAHDGLTSDVAVGLLVDREGTIWAGTNLGLNRFRRTDAVTQLGLPPEVRGGFQQVLGADGTLFLTFGRALYRAGPDGVLARQRALPDLPSMLAMDGTGLALAFGGRIATLHDGQLSPLPALPGDSDPLTWGRDSAGVVWVSAEGEGVFRLDRGRWLPFRSSNGPAFDRTLRTLDGPQAGHWFYTDEALFRYDGRLLRRLPQSNFGVGRVTVITAIDGGFLAGGDNGLAWFDGNRMRRLTADRLPLFSRVTGIAVTPGGDVWINGIRGVARTTLRALGEAFGGAPLAYRPFDMGDGLPGFAQQDSPGNTALAGPDGRIWLALNRGVATIDPQRLRRNVVPPPVQVRGVRAGEQDYPLGPEVLLKTGARSLRIEYTALSLARPERVQFRYRLVGVDEGWVAAGQRREAFYTQLHPGRWTFEVMAANEDGVWSRQPARLTVVIPSHFYETRWFYALCALLAAIVGVLAYRRRTRELVARTRLALDGQVEERERIARELHDTFLQSVQALMLQFHAAALRLGRDDPVRAHIERALDQGDDVLIQGREKVRGLRGAIDSEPIDRQIAAIVARERAMGKAEIAFTMIGKVRPVSEAVQAELVAIVGEALANTRVHAGATRVDVRLRWRLFGMELSVADDGCGLGDTVLNEGERPGHFGLVGMRERAARIGADIAIGPADIDSGAGTRISLWVPGRVAYEHQSARRASGR